MSDGVIVFNKPREFTSHDVVAKLRGILKTRRIGHAGTLDPMAEGVLVVLVGAATRASSYLTADSKTYRAGIRFGLISDTLDIWGEVRKTGAELPDREAFITALMSFEGGYDQTPPMYSAKQKDGARLYELARRGVEVERESHRVDISSIRPLGFEGGRADFELTCSKGTYIRSLCHDIGQRLGCGAVMDSLLRTSSGGFSIDDAVGFDDLETLRDAGRLHEAIIPMERIFARLPSVRLSAEGTRRALNGAYVSAAMICEGEIPPEDELCALYAADGRLAALGRGGRLTVTGESAIFHEKTFYIGDRP